MSSTNNNTTRRAFLVAEVGANANGDPIAVQVEGYTANPPYFKPAEGDKKAYLAVRIGVNLNPENLMARANATWEKGKDYGPNEGFIEVNAFGKTAEALAQIPVGTKLAVSGKMAWREFTRKDNTPDKALTIAANNVFVCGGRNQEAQLTSSVAVNTVVFAGQDGVQRTKTMATFTGEVVFANELNTTSAKPRFTFGVKAQVPAAKLVDLVSGTYSKDKEYDAQKKMIRVTVFDKAAEALAKSLRVGSWVLVTGTPENHEYNGEVSQQMVARNVTTIKYAPKPEDGQAAAPAPAGTVAAATEPPVNEPEPDTDEYGAWGDDDDGELPF